MQEDEKIIKFQIDKNAFIFYKETEEFCIVDVDSLVVKFRTYINKDNVNELELFGVSMKKFFEMEDKE